MSRISLLMLVLLTGCSDFRDAEIEFCLEHLDKCADSSTLAEYPQYTAHVSARQMPGAGPDDGRGYDVKLVFDAGARRLGYWVARPGDEAGLHVDVDLGAGAYGDSGERITTGTGERGMLTDVPPTLVTDLPRGRVFVAVRVQGKPQLRGQVVPAGAMLLLAELSWAEAVPPGPRGMPTGFASAVLDFAHQTVSFNAVSPLVVDVYRGMAGVPSTEKLTRLAGKDTVEPPVSKAQLDELAWGLYYVTTAPPGNRGQLLDESAVLYVARSTASQHIPPSGDSSTSYHAMIIAHPGRTDMVLATDAPRDQGPSFAPGPFGANHVGADFGLSFPEAPANLNTNQDVADLLQVRGVYFETATTRGQLLRPGESLYGATLDATGAAPPPSTSLQTGTAQLVLSPDRLSCIVTGYATGGPVMANVYDTAPTSPLLSAYRQTNGIFTVTDTTPLQVLSAIDSSNLRILVTYEPPAGPIGGRFSLVP